jgi:acetyltransferase-like isoleucine patch superfamily enzyme
VIGAGSVVSRDIPARCLAAGMPAKVIRENVDWSWNKFPDKMPEEQALDQ